MRSQVISPPDASPSSSSGMQLRKFVAPTMAEALTRVKSELGFSAVILSTRTVQQRRWMGLVRREHVEITAGQGIRTVPRRTARPAPAAPPRQAPFRPYAQAASPSAPAAVASAPGRDLLATPAATSVAYLGVTQEIGELKRIVGDLVVQFRHSQTPDVPKAFFPGYRALREAGVDEELARDLIADAGRDAPADELADDAAVRRRVHGAVEGRLTLSGPVSRTAKGRPHIIALIGPTGVGKTTTVAKLAATLKLREHKKVGLITIDTYRIAAIDQLKKYADIIDSTLAVVSSPSEIKDAVARMGDHDFVIIDTAGRSPRDAVKLRELQQFLAAASPDEVHLVLSATCGSDSMKLAMERFAGVRCDKLIFTKLDEAAHAGVLLNVATAIGRPVSYLTTGQDVPDDIEVAAAPRLAQLIMGGSL